MVNSEDIPLYMISVVANMLDIHPQTLRLYEREGLVQPKRTKGNTRLYSENDIERIKQIMTLTRDMGVNLAGAEIILNLKAQMEELKLTFYEVISFIEREMNNEFAGFEDKFKKAIVRAPHQQIVKSVLTKDEK
ncbi:heat shock protein transcriptional repressor HspR [candidate division CSSED10-310 bacterium]|uniref:Heat shock protein transcriptional repressor HspR n=1 Tax=candidate division CSSED10-310 bacterium TaxID=2855610 RepID=A0ABV6Z2U3_UNCC1